MELPTVTIATATLNCAEAFRLTRDSVLAQSYPLEWLVVDGGSRDGTPAIAREAGARCVSGRDRGPYDAMNRAAELAQGDYILFMNAGDWFCGGHAVANAMVAATPDADFIIGDYFYRRGGEAVLHRVSEFAETWAILRSGDGTWLKGVPCHQATFTRTDLLRKEKYDLRFRIAADHEFMLRQYAKGASFHRVDVPIATYCAGGLSEMNHARCLREWRKLARRYVPLRTRIGLVLTSRFRGLAAHGPS